jgi:hypothetical protein
MDYTVVIEVREQGALGVFSLVRFGVLNVADEDAARAAAMAQAHACGFETRAVWKPEAQKAGTA